MTSNIIAELKWRYRKVAVKYAVETIKEFVSGVWIAVLTSAVLGYFGFHLMLLLNGAYAK